MKKSEITLLELKEQLKWEIKQLESMLQKENEYPVDDLLEAGIPIHRIVTESRNQKIRAMIHELRQQIKEIGDRRGEIIADKQWFLDLCMNHQEKQVFIDVYQHKKNFIEVANEYGITISQAKNMYRSAFKKVQQEAKKRVRKGALTKM